MVNNPHEPEWAQDAKGVDCTGGSGVRPGRKPSLRWARRSAEYPLSRKKLRIIARAAWLRKAHVANLRCLVPTRMPPSSKRSARIVRLRRPVRSCRRKAASSRISRRIRKTMRRSAIPRVSRTASVFRKIDRSSRVDSGAIETFGSALHFALFLP